MDIQNYHNIVHYLLNILLGIIKEIFQSLIFILIALIGLVIFQTKQMPLDIVVGLPLLAIGGGLLINSFYNLILTFFSPIYNKAVCIFCPENNN